MIQGSMALGQHFLFLLEDSYFEFDTSDNRSVAESL